jgi:hypothetical protein
MLKPYGKGIDAYRLGYDLKVYFGIQAQVFQSAFLLVQMSLGIFDEGS